MCRYFEQQKKKFALDFVPHLVFRFSCRASKFVAFYSFVVACFCHGIHFGWFGSLWLFYLIPQLIHSHQPPNRTPIFSLSLSFASRLTHAMSSIFCVCALYSFVCCSVSFAIFFLLLLPCMCSVSFLHFCWLFRFRWAIYIFFSRFIFSILLCVFYSVGLVIYCDNLWAVCLKKKPHTHRTDTSTLLRLTDDERKIHNRQLSKGSFEEHENRW